MKAAPDPVTSVVVVEARSGRLVVTGGAFVREPPTLARRFPVGPGDGTSTRWYLHCPYLMKSLSDHLLSAVIAL